MGAGSKSGARCNIRARQWWLQAAQLKQRRSNSGLVLERLDEVQLNSDKQIDLNDGVKTRNVVEPVNRRAELLCPAE